MGKSVLIDLTRCTGCRGCQVACKQWNERAARKTVLNGDFTNPPEMSSDCYTRIKFIEHEKNGKPMWSFVKDQCLHCKEPACVSVCPVGALEKSKEGPVKYSYDKCIGCRYCMVACPFHIPKYEWEKVLPWVQKCSFCSERINDGMEPACVKVCPTDTMFYGEQDVVMAEAKKRIKENPGKYVNHIYGKDEAGGTAWMYISGVPFEELGFRMNIPKQSLPAYTWASLSTIPGKATAIVAGLVAIAYFRNRGNSEEDK
ncbi:MAG: 4Fe-4S dicluster domain-containing protein [Proteobacteria bacterium]|nr:4Fe-4S dicluster domain-containing protein [Pseudomonadota bacterium]MBU4117293.1 4Fe-4S dicluster domain-containing protein [Pseudomonadota bacterium]